MFQPHSLLWCSCDSICPWYCCWAFNSQSFWWVKMQILVFKRSKYKSIWMNISWVFYSLSTTLFTLGERIYQDYFGDYLLRRQGLFSVWRLFSIWQLFSEEIVFKIISRWEINLKITLRKSHQNSPGRCVHLTYLNTYYDSAN